MKRRVCCLLLGLCILCLPAGQVYAAPEGPAAHAEEKKEEKKKPHEKEHEKPVPPHEKKQEKPVPTHEKKQEKPVPPHEKKHEKPEDNESEITPVITPAVIPTATPTVAPTAIPKPTAAPTQAPSEESADVSADTNLGHELVNYALQFVGNPYRYGGTSLTDGADCSGFVQSVYEHFHYDLDRTSREQAKTAGYMEVAVKESALQPGDLIFYANSSGAVYHVAIYIGDGTVVHAANSKKGITVSDYTYMKPYKARRVIE